MGQVNSVGIEMMYCVKYNVTNLYVFSRSTYIFVVGFLYTQKWRGTESFNINCIRSRVKSVVLRHNIINQKQEACFFMENENS